MRSNHPEAGDDGCLLLLIPLAFLLGACTVAMLTYLF
jgi:hypothetical protein